MKLLKIQEKNVLKRAEQEIRGGLQKLSGNSLWKNCLRELLKQRQEGSYNVKENRNKCEWIKENTEVKPSKDKYYNYGVYENNELIGGAVGTIRFGQYFLEELWVDEKYRGKNIGSTLIEKVEECAKSNRALGVRMETWNFQARGFYEKKGYKVYATFEDCPPGTIDYLLKKRF